MNPTRGLKPVTRRAIPLLYISPAECRLIPAFSGSGSGASETASLDIFPVERMPGPAVLTAVTVAGGVQLDWSPVEGAFSFVVYASASAEGPFSVVAANVLPTEFLVDASMVGGFFYWKVTALEPNFGETFPSPVVSTT